jgi:hypothetical protein
MTKIILYIIDKWYLINQNFVVKYFIQCFLCVISKFVKKVKIKSMRELETNTYVISILMFK